MATTAIRATRAVEPQELGRTRRPSFLSNLSAMINCMEGWIPPRLRGLLGQDLGLVDEAALRHMIGLPEDTDLEFKVEAYEATTGQAKEAAYDIAGLANAGGGLLIFGVAEDGAGNASAFEPLAALDRDFGLWIHQVLAARTSPPVTITHRAVPFEDGLVHLVGIVPSIYAPHGVDVGDGALRFPVRTGTTRRWLSEVEVSDRYRRRFASLGASTDALRQMAATAEDSLPPDDRDEPWAWLVVTLVPDFSGNLELYRGLADEWRDWINPTLRLFPGFDRGPLHITLGFRSLVTHDVADPNVPARTIGGRLELGGSGFLIFGYPLRRVIGGEGVESVPIYDEHLIGDLVNSIGVLASHAVRCGGYGNGQVSARIISRQAPMILAHYRQGFSRQLPNTRVVARTTGVSEHTIPLAATSLPSLEQLQVARFLAIDLGSSFGQAEPQQISAGGELVLNHFRGEAHGRLLSWAEVAGVASVPNRQ